MSGDGDRGRVTTRDDDEGGGAHVGSLTSAELVDGCCEAAFC